MKTTEKKETKQGKELDLSKETKVLNIREAVCKIISELEPIQKNGVNEQKNYPFMKIDDLMNVLHGLFAKYHIFPIPEVISYETKESLNTNGLIQYTTRMTVKYHFTSQDGSEIVTTTCGEGTNLYDKSMNKAMTAAFKYALMQLFMIHTSDMVDADKTTPAETVPQPNVNSTQKNEAISRPNSIDGGFEIALKKLEQCNSSAEVTSIWNTNPQLHTNKEFIDKVAEKGNYFKNRNM